MLEATISRFFSYPAVGVISANIYSSSSHKLADTDPASTLDSCSGTQNVQKNVHNNVIEAEIITLST